MRRRRGAAVRRLEEYDRANHRYVPRFAKGQWPPADAFWSLTMYDTDFFFVPNAIDRYDLGGRNKLTAHADGAVEIYLQADSPGSGNDTNWLQAPRGKFNRVMRLYEPRTTPPSILDGSWRPPGVQWVD